MAPKVLADNGGVTEKVFFDFDRAYNEAKSKMASAAAHLKTVKKRGEDDGIDIQEYEYQRKRRNRPIEERRKSYENGRLYLKYWKDPIGAQLSEIKEVKDEVGLSEEERFKKWEDEGYVAGISGKNRDTCPHDDPNSLGARHWMKGYDEGQAKLGKGFKQKAPDAPAPEKAKEPVQQPEKAKPKDEPEVAAAKAKRGKSQTGVTYWHNAEIKKVYAVPQSDAEPAGAVSITKAEYDKLAAEYAKAEEDEWDREAAQQAAAKAEDGDNDEDEDEAPPAPTLN